MKNTIISLLAICCCPAAKAQQQTTRSLSIEILGAQNVAGIN